MPIDFPPLPGSREAEEYRRAQDEFHLRLGYCIAEWAKVERELFRIFWAALRGGQEQAATVFYYLNTLDGRFQLTDELVRVILPKTVPGKQPHADLKAWDAIKTEFKRLIPTRNHLAHQPVEGELVAYEIDGDEPGEISMRGILSWFRSRVSEAEFVRGKKKWEDYLTDRHLEEHLRDTGNLAKWFEKFWRDTLPTHAAELPPPSDPYRRHLVPKTHPDS